MMSSTNGIVKGSLTVMALSYLKSITILISPFFFANGMGELLYFDVEGSMMSRSNRLNAKLVIQVRNSGRKKVGTLVRQNNQWNAQYGNDRK